MDKDSRHKTRKCLLKESFGEKKFYYSATDNSLKKMKCFGADTWMPNPVEENKLLRVPGTNEKDKDFIDSGLEGAVTV